MTGAFLIGRVCQGDERAWETFIEEHQQAVFRLAYLMLGDAGEAEDVAQETFLRTLPAQVSAGKWAVVTLDAEPTNPRPDQSFTIGFVVRQDVSSSSMVFGQS